MNVVVQPSDVTSALTKVGAFRDPVGLAGKVVGLGQSEMQAGIPAWALCAAAFAAGLMVGAKYGRGIPVLGKLLK